MNEPPFLPYSRQRITEEDIEAVVEALRSPIISQGSRLGRFEEEFAAEAGASFAVGFSSGTAALHGMSVAAGIGPGDEVIVPAITFAATANAVLYAGGKPVFADIDPTTACIDVDAAARAITNATRAILAVDLGGRPADYPRLRDLAERHGLLLLADAAHSPGARIGDRVVLDYVDMAAYSFNPVKNLTTGEGGMVAGKEAHLASTLQQFRVHGMTRDPELLTSAPPGEWYYEQQFLGFNYKLSELHAALGLGQLRRLPEHNARRRELAAYYDESLAELPVERPVRTEGVVSSWHLYVVRVAGEVRNALFDFLRSRGLGVQIHYIPVPLHPYYRGLGYTMDGLPNAQAYYESALSLPLHQSMTRQDVDRVVASLKQFFAA